jgi:hypothetical protein
MGKPFVGGGGRGIRTPGALRLNGFQVLWSRAVLYHPVSSSAVLYKLQVRLVLSCIVLYHPVWFAARLQNVAAFLVLARLRSCP